MSVPMLKGLPSAGIVVLCAVVGSAWRLGAQAAPATPPAQAIDPAWLQTDTAAKSVTFQLIAGLTGLNGALNFNGFADGHLTLSVPEGWTVLIHFRNHDGMLPHSAEVILETHPLPITAVAPAFPRAETIRLAEGLISEQTDDLRFVANKGGSYLISCGVSGHATAGMWIRLEVSGFLSRPSLGAAAPVGQR
jgi:sulfocyanin SoxE-like protein